MKIDLTRLTVAGAHTHMKAGNFSAVDLARAYLDHIKKHDDDVHAYLEVFFDVEEQAKAADARFAEGSETPMTGIPLAIKDNMLIKGRNVSAASKILEGYTASYDATVIAKLREAGAVFLGRTNMDEFAMGSSTENSAFGITKNPHDAARVPGGSSGGSAAAVAGHMALGALGSDTGGSIRQPASFCGVVGLKPTYGAVSRFGLIAMGSSLDQIGPLARTVEDTRLIYEYIAGHDPKDSTSVLNGADQKKTKASYTIGIPKNIFESAGMDEPVRNAFENTLEGLKRAGHTITEIEIPLLSYALAGYYIIMPAEASTNLARFDGVRYGLHKDGSDGIEDYFKTRREGFGKEVRRRILLGTYVLSAGYKDAYYNKAMQVRARITKDFEEAYQKVDVVVMPTSPTPAFGVGERADDPLQMYLADIFTVPINLTGLPAISVPMETQGLPLGFQIVAPHFHENYLFDLGAQVESL